MTTESKSEKCEWGMKVALYARVSTKDKGQDPEVQLNPMREYCQRMAWLHEEFIDKVSGTRASRLALDDLLKRLKRKEFDILMVWKLDRLARSIKQLVDIVYGELQPRNIDFICLTQQMDTTTPTGKLLFVILGALAEFEHDLISERVKEGMSNAKRKGVALGRKQVISNYTNKGKDLRRRLLDAYQGGLSVRGAARVVDLTPGTAHRYLKQAGVLE